MCIQLLHIDKSDRTDHLIYNNYMREPDGIPYSHAAGSFDSHDIFIARPEPNRRSSRRPLKEQRLRRPNDRNEEQANADTDTLIRTVLNAVIGDTA